MPDCRDLVAPPFCQRCPPAVSGTIQECAYCERIVWLEPDGSKSEYTLRPVVNDAGEVTEIQGLGRPRVPHDCRPPRPWAIRRAATDPPSEPHQGTTLEALEKLLAKTGSQL